MTSVFSVAVENAQITLQNWAKVIAFLEKAEGPGGEKFNQEADVPGTDQELWWFDERAIAVSNLVQSLEKVEIDSGAPVPLAYIEQLEQASQQLKDSILEIVAAVEQAEANGIASLTPGNWVIVVKQTNANLNFASFLQNIRKFSENLLT